MAATTFRTLDEADLKGKRALVRVDLNVPMEDGRVTDATRIDRILPTIREISKSGGRVVLLAHFGRPKGKPTEADSLKPLAAVLSERLGQRVAFAKDCVGPDAETAVGKLKNGGVLLLENTRFHAGEEKNEKAFVAKLAKLGDLYVNDAFSAAHRAHASTEGLAHKLPAYAGRTMQAELEALRRALETPIHPVVAIVGGAKVSTKIDLLENLVAKVDMLVIGGGMANTFLNAIDISIGVSLAERDLGPTVQRVLDRAKETGCAILLPVDGVVATEFKADAPHRAYGIESIPRDGMILDIGPRSTARINAAIDDARTLVWNGPVGAFELSPFDRGTVTTAKHAAARTKAGKLVSVAGGGDTVAALNKAGVAGSFSYVSTAGGAFLEWLEGKTLPGVAALSPFRKAAAVEKAPVPPKADAKAAVSAKGKAKASAKAAASKEAGKAAAEPPAKADTKPSAKSPTKSATTAAAKIPAKAAAKTPPRGARAEAPKAAAIAPAKRVAPAREAARSTAAPIAKAVVSARAAAARKPARAKATA